MKTIILQSLFNKKASLYLPRLAYSDANIDVSYEQLANVIAAISSEIKNEYSVNHSKVLLTEDNPVTALFILLALIRLKADVIISLGEIPEDMQPDLIINNGAALLANALQQKDNTYYEQSAPVSRMDIHFSLYTPGQPGGIVYTTESLETAFTSLNAGIAPLETDRYFIADNLAPAHFIVETLWCLFNGIQVLHFPGSEGKVELLQPGKEKFIMDFSLFFFGSTRDNMEAENCYELLMNSVKHADKYNYSAVWTPERHFNEFGGRFPNPSVLSAAIAVATEKVQIRTGSIVAPLHHVIRIAEDWSVIDNLSGGRTALSFASGWQCNDFIFSPENYPVRHEVMLAQIEQFKKLWKGEQLPFKNGVGDEISIGIFPRPVQKEMPIWITVSGKEETFVDAGRIGANILTHLLWQDPSDLIQKIGAYRRSLRENGFDPASRTVSVMLHTYVGKSSEAVRKIVKEPLKAYIRSSVHLVETMTAAARNTNGNNAIGRYGRNDEKMSDSLKEELLDIAFERFFNHASLLGDHEQCKKTLERLHSYGVDELACLIDFGLEDDIILEGLEELKTLKAAYHPAAQKRYAGSFILRASAPLLSELHKASRTTVNGFKKIVTTSASDMEQDFAFQDQINISYELENDVPVITAEEDNTFHLMKAKIFEMNLAQASEQIDEDF